MDEKNQENKNAYMKQVVKTKTIKYMFVWTKRQSIVCNKRHQDCRDIMIRVCEGNAMFDNYRYRNNLRRLKTCK